MLSLLISADLIVYSLNTTMFLCVCQKFLVLLICLFRKKTPRLLGSLNQNTVNHYLIMKSVVSLQGGPKVGKKLHDSLHY